MSLKQLPFANWAVVMARGYRLKVRFAMCTCCDTEDEGMSQSKLPLLSRRGRFLEGSDPTDEGVSGA